MYLIKVDQLFCLLVNLSPSEGLPKEGVHLSPSEGLPKEGVHLSPSEGLPKEGVNQLIVTSN